MAVIITNMDMPKSCSDCPICHCKGKDEPWNFCCFATMDDINVEEWDNDRFITCPLKSADEMIAEIRDYSNKYTTINVDTKKVVVEALLCIISKYCDKENKGFKDGIKGSIPKDQYEARLKADMVAMLTEIQLEIEEKAIRKQGIDSGFEYDYEFISSEEVVEIIQQKIDKLKGIEDDKI